MNSSDGRGHWAMCALDALGMPYLPLRTPVAGAPRRADAVAMRYCVGITMATDWGEDADAQAIDRRLIRRVLTYFRPGVITRPS